MKSILLSLCLWVSMFDIAHAFTIHYNRVSIRYGYFSIAESSQYGSDVQVAGNRAASIQYDFMELYETKHDNGWRSSITFGLEAFLYEYNVSPVIDSFISLENRNSGGDLYTTVTFEERFNKTAYAYIGLSITPLFYQEGFVLSEMYSLGFGYKLTEHFNMITEFRRVNDQEVFYDSDNLDLSGYATGVNFDTAGNAILIGLSYIF